MSSLKKWPREVRTTLIATLVVGASLTSWPAFAGTPDPGYDGNVHFVVGEGAVTPYLMNQQIENMYNGSPGCTLDAGTSTFNFNQCKSSTLGTDPVGSNFDHNVVSAAFQITSGNGISMLTHTPYPNVVTPTVVAGHRVDIADTNRNPLYDNSVTQTTADPTGLTWNSLAKDAQTVFTFKGRTQANTLAAGFTQAILKGIFEDCTITQWNQIPGVAVTDTAAIDLYGPATSAGTYVDVTKYLGVTSSATVAPFGMNTCLMRNFGSSHIITVNNSKPIESDPNAVNALWWASNGVLSAHPTFRGTGSAWTTLDGVPLNPATTSCFSSFGVPDTCDPNNGGPGKWPVQQQFFNVVLSQANAVTPTVTPGTDPPGLGQLGAVRAFRDWECKASGQSVVNPATGNNYHIDIINRVGIEGFVAPPSNQTSASTNPGNVSPSTGASDTCIWFQT